MTDNTKKTRRLADTKSRTLLVVVTLVIIVGAVIGYLVYLRNRQSTAVPTSAALQSVPGGIQSIPGVGQTTEQYAQLVEQSNIQQAERAAQTGTSAVPTLVRASYQGPADFGPSTADSGNQACSLSALQRAREAGVTAVELRCANCSAQQLLAAGYTPGELANAGFGANELAQAGVSAAALRDAGYSAAELKRAGYTCQQLLAAGYDPKEIAQAGYSQDQLKQCLSATQLQSLAAAASLPAGFPKDCSAASLQAAHQQNISATQIRNVLGCSAQELKAGGYSAADLKAAGFTAGDLRKAGFSAKQLKDAGFTPAELRDAGYTAGELKDAGFTRGQLANAGYSEGDLIRAGFGKADFPKDCSVASLQAARQQGISANSIREALHCTASQFAAGGYSAKALRDAGFTPSDLQAAGFTPADIAGAGYPTAATGAPALPTAAGAVISPQAVGTHPSAAALKAEGFTPSQLKAAGYSAKDLKDAGFTPEQLRAAGYTAKQLLAAGYTPDELRKAGYSEGQIAAAESALTGATGTTDADATADQGGPQAGAALPYVSTPQSQAEWLTQLRKQQQRELSQQQKQAAIQQLQQAMMSQANDLVRSWAPPSVQEFTVGVAATSSSSASTPGGSGTSASSESSNPGDVVKAGSIMFAVLDTGINSDEQSPILATIVQGKLKGAKLLGRFSRVNQKVVLSFSIISIPSASRSLTLNAVAIDPNTARTALASRVNNHYLLRYGTLFASSFISGLGQAIENSGSTTTGLPGGTFVTTYQSLNKTQLTLAALGNVGTQYADVLGNVFNTPPTVYVKAGMGIGILFMSDFNVPVSDNSNQPAQQISFNSNGEASLPAQQYQAASE